jgi:hypothetical protein
MIGRELWMKMRGVEHVEEILGLWDELIPNCCRAFFISCNEVILEGLDGLLGALT